MDGKRTRERGKKIFSGPSLSFRLHNTVVVDVVAQWVNSMQEEQGTTAPDKESSSSSMES